MPGRIPASFKAQWARCQDDKRAAIAEAAEIRAAKKRVDARERAARAEAAAAKKHEAALKKEAAAAKREAMAARKAAREANRGVAGPGELGFARYLREKAAPKAATPVARRTRARAAALL
jgi:hypothetical protein